MEILILLFLLTVVILVLGLVIYAAVLLWRKALIFRWLISFFAIFVLVQLYWAGNPRDSFYIYDFERMAPVKFPASGKIVRKYASLLDFHGDYESCALIEVSPEDFQVLSEAIIKGEPPMENKQPYSCGSIDAAGKMPKYKFSKRKEVVGGSISEWGVLEGGQWVYFSYSSW